MGEKSTSPGRSLTEACVLRSRNIILLKAAMLQNRQAQFFLDRTPPALPSRRYLNEIAMEATNRIDEYQRDIARYLQQIVLLNKKDTMVGDKFCFSSKELKDGYIFFYKHAYSNYITGVLVLGEFENKPEDKIKIEPGMIFEFNEIKGYLNQIKSATEHNIVFNHASKKIKKYEKRTN